VLRAMMSSRVKEGSAASLVKAKTRQKQRSDRILNTDADGILFCLSIIHGRRNISAAGKSTRAFIRAGSLPPGNKRRVLARKTQLDLSRGKPARDLRRLAQINSAGVAIVRLFSVG